MAIAGSQRAAKGSRLQVNNNSLTLGKWEADWKGDDLDTSNFESGGYEQGLIGFNVCELSGGGFWDAHVAPYADPPGIYPRSDGGPVKLYTNVADNVFWNLPIVRFLSGKNGADVKGLVSFDFSGKSNSTFTAPTTSI